MRGITTLTNSIIFLLNFLFEDWSVFVRSCNLSERIRLTIREETSEYIEKIIWILLTVCSVSFETTLRIIVRSLERLFIISDIEMRTIQRIITDFFLSFENASTRTNERPMPDITAKI